MSISSPSLCVLISIGTLLLSAAPVQAGSGGSPLTPYGFGTTGKGNVIPKIWAEDHPSPGSASFKLRLDAGVGGAPSLLLTATGSASIHALGIDLLVDPFTSFMIVPWAGTLTGTAGQAGAGSAVVPFPIPNAPILTGLVLHSQFLVFDTSVASGLCASDGLRMELQQSPLVVACGNAALRSYNYRTKAYTNIGGAGYPVDAQFNTDGSLCLIVGRTAMSGSSNSVRIFDSSLTPMKLLKTVAISGSVLNHCVVHPNNKRAYVSAGGTPVRVQIVDIDKSSAKFGTIIGQVTGFPGTKGMLEGGSISANGKVLCVCDLGLGSTAYLHVIDVDPASAKRDTLRATYRLSSGMATDVEVGPHGVYAYLCFATFGLSSVYTRVFLPTGRVTQRATFGNNALFPTDIDIDPRGRFLVAACSNSSNLVYIDLRPGAGFFKGSVFQTAPQGAKPFSVALTPDGAFAVATSMNKGIYAWDTKTKLVAWTVNQNGGGSGIAVR